VTGPGASGPGASGPGASTSLWVIIPAYNEAARIGGTLDCLAAQTDSDFTLVVVDNGSTDETTDTVRTFATGAPFGVRVISEDRKGVGCAADTGFRYAIGCGARHLARTDADCLPHPGWVAAARKELASGAGMVIGQIRARRDEHGVLGRAAFRILVGLAAAFGRLRPGNRRGHGYLVPYRMHAGNNMAITASVYVTSGGLPRRSCLTDRAFFNAVRASTAAIVNCRAMVVENSTRRLRAYGLIGTARWYLHGDSGGHAADPR
jgi:glycosyltransferase involved in cell wall biosynthesis